MIRSRRWSDLTAPEVVELVARDPVVILPTAAVEQHGPHLPLSTDVDIGEGLVNAALRDLPESFAVAVLPTLAVSASEEHGGDGGTLSLTAEEMVNTVVSIGRSLAHAGVRRLVLSNSHGGNKAALDIAALRLRREQRMLVVKSHWFRFPVPEGVDLPPAEWRHGLHGGAVETSMMLHLRPDAVRRDEIRDFPSLGAELESTLARLGPEGTASFAWEAHDLNPHGVTGNAALATEEIGHQLVEGYGLVLAEVLQDASHFPVERLGS